MNYLRVDIDCYGGVPIYSETYSVALQLPYFIQEWKSIVDLEVVFKKLRKKGSVLVPIKGGDVWFYLTILEKDDE